MCTAGYRCGHDRGTLESVQSDRLASPSVRPTQRATGTTCCQSLAIASAAKQDTVRVMQTA